VRDVHRPDRGAGATRALKEADVKHMDRQEALIQGLFRSTRTVAVIGASPRPDRHSRDVVSYLHREGYEVIPVRPDRQQVEGLPTFAALEDFGGSVDLAVIFRRPEDVTAHIREAAAKKARAVWLQPGTWSPEAEAEAERQGVALIKERCIIEEHKHVASATGETGAGHPPKPGVHLGERGRRGEPVEHGGYEAGGGGGTRGGGGVRAVLNEKKMTQGKKRR
jgi:uncharacterized protein